LVARRVDLNAGCTPRRRSPAQRHADRSHRAGGRGGIGADPSGSESPRRRRADAGRLSPDDPRWRRDQPWSPFWDAYYTYELAQLPDGSWSPSTSRAAAEEDLYQEWPRDWSDHWHALTMPTVVVRAMKPLNGALIVPDHAIAALAATNPAVRVVETPESNHFTCIVDPMTLAAIQEISQP
jgi:hypothetical protein